MKSLLLPSIRVLIVTQLVCVGIYLRFMLSFAQVASPETALASFIKNADGRPAGSRLVAQGFTKAEYIWPRPSAVNYDGAGAGGSNKSPTSPELTDRAKEILARHGATPERLLPADLATASGSGLDPFITEAAARFQLPRVAAARGVSVEQIEPLLDKVSTTPGGFLTGARIVNVLELNLALDASK